MPWWVFAGAGFVVWLATCAVADARYDVDLAGWTGRLLGLLAVLAVAFGMVWGATVLIVGHDPLGLGFDKASPPSECQMRPSGDPLSC